MADASAEEKAKRVRSLLSAYYTSGAEDAPGRAGGRSAASIDSAAFDADAYISTLVRTRPPPALGLRTGLRCSCATLVQLKKTRLDQLHSKYTSMSSEIRALDSDMQARTRAHAQTAFTARPKCCLARVAQMLVYENYSKFITATDTIRRMKDNVEEMGGRMEELQASTNRARVCGFSARCPDAPRRGAQSTIAATAHASEHVNAKLGKHRDEIEQLNNVRGLLKKLQSVFDLPARLRACVELGSLASAVREYAAAAPLLERFGTGAFASVARDVSGTVKEIGDKLRATLRDPATRPDDAAEALELLQMLRLPQDELQREWLSERRKALSDAIRAATQAWAAVGDVASSGTTNKVANWLSGLNAAYLAELMQTVKSYKEVRARRLQRWCTTA